MFISVLMSFYACYQKMFSKISKEPYIQNQINMTFHKQDFFFLIVGNTFSLHLSDFMIRNWKPVKI